MAGGSDDSVTLAQRLSALPVSESQNFCIFEVHTVLRSVNEKAYEPQIISIGPYHRGKPHLQVMEEYKLRFLKLLLERNQDNVETYSAAVELQELEARLCYAGQIHLSSEKFVEMMVLDGCFIIELLLRFQERKRSRSRPPDRNDPLFNMEWTLTRLQRDLMLLENQLPLSILHKLYELVELPEPKIQFIDLALVFFNDLFPGFAKKSEIENPQNIKHLLDVIHTRWVSQLQPREGHTWNMENIELIGSATELAAAGIKFEKIDKKFSFDIVFDHGLLRIPVIIINGRTECFLRNLIAYEQHCGDTDSNIVTDYVTVFDCLIKSVEDVAKLCRCGIIRNFVGDNELIYRMFCTMTTGIIAPSMNFHYAERFKQVNVYRARTMTRLMASLERKYTHSSWGMISILAACMLLILTVLQVIFQIVSWKKPTPTN